MKENNHVCSSVVVACIDYRFQDHIRKWIEENISGGYYFVGIAGSTKDLETIKNQGEISVRLHNIKNAFLIHHENCGAYGDESTPEKHTEDLKKAKEEINKIHPKLRVNLYYLHLNGDFKNVG